MLYKNLNSLSPIPSRTSELLFAYIDFLSNTWQRIPCYLVDSELMTEIYGDRYFHTLNEDCARKMADHLPEELQNIDIFWDHIEKCQDNNIYPKRYHVALGIYVSCLSNERREIIKQYTYHDVPPSPAIFICPERIDSLASTTQAHFSHLSQEEIFKILFVNVYFHELTHAFIDRRQVLSQLWERVIDESLVTAVAHSLFREQHEQAILRFAATKLPVQYRGYNCWLSDTQMSNAPRLWSNTWRYFCYNGTLPQEIHPPRFMKTSFRSIVPKYFNPHRRGGDAIIQQPNFPTLLWKGLAAIIFRQALGLE